MDKTLIPAEDDTWGLPTNDSSDAPPPRLTILFHSDLSRIGASTAPDVLGSGDWVTVGRTEPGFIMAPPAEKGGALANPYISRNQFKIRWMEARQRFEVEVPPESRRPVVVVDLAQDKPGPVITSIKGKASLEPGTLIGIGNSVLLLLDCSPWRGITANRLDMIGETAGAWALRDDIAKIARFDKPALVLGPTGAGKELVARAVHALSKRSKRPFVPVNCAAVPEHLAESLLFGHRKGAFTGADTASDGLFRDADGGTLFLDEVGELPMPLQAKLLRAIQEGTVTPVGSSRPIAVDVRVVAATNRTPTTEIDAGNLREDFFYRVSTHTVSLPSLEARRWDIPLIFTHFLAQTRQDHPEQAWMWQGQKASKPPVPMAFFVELMRRPWPGNIRELHNAVERTLRDNLHGGPFVVPEFARPDSPSGSRSTRKATAMDQDTQLWASKQLGIARKTFERVISNNPGYARRDTETDDTYVERLRALWIEDLLVLFVREDFNQVRLSEELGMARNTLVRLMKTFGIPRTREMSAPALAKAHKDSSGDLDAMAKALGLSARPLEVYLRHKGLGHMLNP